MFRSSRALRSPPMPWRRTLPSTRPCSRSGPCLLRGGAGGVVCRHLQREARRERSVVARRAGDLRRQPRWPHHPRRAGEGRERFGRSAGGDRCGERTRSGRRLRGSLCELSLRRSARLLPSSAETRCVALRRPIAMIRSSTYSRSWFLALVFLLIGLVPGFAQTPGVSRPGFRRRSSSTSAPAPFFSRRMPTNGRRRRAWPRS